MTEDWYAWHADYDQPGSALSRRVAELRERIRESLDDAPPGPLRVISLCAGGGAICSRCSPPTPGGTT